LTKEKKYNMDKKDYHIIINRSRDAQDIWKDVPAPIRGKLIRTFRLKLFQNKEILAKLITSDSKKIYKEALGEVFNSIEMCEFGQGLSRQLYGLTMPSEKQDHTLKEMWHPLGIVGIISAFNFPCAVWAWNHVLAIVCGNSVVWKPSPRGINVARKCKELWDQSILEFLSYNKIRHTQGNRFHLQDLLQIVEGGNQQAEWMADDTRIHLLSATGSTEMGKSLAPRVSARMGRGLYELSGNNAIIVSHTANIDLAVKAIVSSAIATAGQRCTTVRRVIIQTSIYEKVLDRLLSAYKSITVGDPMDNKNMMGPLIDINAVNKMQDILSQCRSKGHIVHGGEIIQSCYVRPAVVEVKEQCDLVRSETFAPIVYVLKYLGLDNAIRMNNIVKQGLTSSIFTDSVQEAELFTSATGSDCGIINVNVGTHGSEIGGAFGGEKETGGGREIGSDSWKQYMRRTTVCINYGNEII
jgi:aldehyde dehydrogenase (NAD+)